MQANAKSADIISGLLEALGGHPATQDVQQEEEAVSGGEDGSLEAADPHGGSMAGLCGS